MAASIDRLVKLMAKDIGPNLSSDVFTAAHGGSTSGATVVAFPGERRGRPAAGSRERRQPGETDGVAVSLKGGAPIPSF